MEKAVPEHEEVKTPKSALHKHHSKEKKTTHFREEDVVEHEGGGIIPIANSKYVELSGEEKKEVLETPGDEELNRRLSLAQENSLNNVEIQHALAQYAEEVGGEGGGAHESSP